MKSKLSLIEPIPKQLHKSFQSIQSLAWAIAPLFSGILIGIYYYMPIVFGGGSILLSGLIYA